MLTACNALWLRFDSEPERQCSENRATLIFEPGKTFQKSLSETQLGGDRHRSYESSCYALKRYFGKELVVAFRRTSRLTSSPIT
jgi:hypothetical protein